MKPAATVLIMSLLSLGACRPMAESSQPELLDQQRHGLQQARQLEQQLQQQFDSRMRASDVKQE